ncbi:hypothetical protein ACFW5V_32260 [Streptomyces sp. NPDC058762]|uniref:hypothetical protein n=1 Tax=Streptomyces sp. NPDC058762 TaxID=3346629 RepID=UPI003681414E
MTISDTTPQKRAGTFAGLDAAILGAESSLTFSIGPDVPPVEAMQQAGAVASMTLPRFLAGKPGADDTGADALAVLTELVDLTARHKAGSSLVGRVSYDGSHITLSVGDMDCPLPTPENEPGLYLVHRVAAEVGQYTGDMGGRVTWAAVAA